MSSFRQNYIPTPAAVPREPSRGRALLLLAVCGLLWAWGTRDDGAEQRRAAQLRLEGYRAGYASARETCTPPQARAEAQP